MGSLDAVTLPPLIADRCSITPVRGVCLGAPVSRGAGWSGYIPCIRSLWPRRREGPRGQRRGLRLINNVIPGRFRREQDPGALSWRFCVTPRSLRASSTLHLHYPPAESNWEHSCFMIVVSTHKRIPWLHGMTNKLASRTLCRLSGLGFTTCVHGTLFPKLLSRVPSKLSISST